MRKVILITLCIAVTQLGRSQRPFQFAFLSDTHIGSQTASEDLARTIKNINADSLLKFVVITGDITEFGSDDELVVARKLFDSLNKPWYIIPGNHDANWSESGSNSFKKIFGAETFQFVHDNYLFIGTASGPNMRMSPGQVPREHLVWLDSILNNMPNKNLPIIYLNHYPQDSSLNNWYEVIDQLKTRNIQLILCGHGHANRQLNFEGIPAVMGRSNLRAKNVSGGFNVVTIQNRQATFEERNPITNDQKKWATVQLEHHDFANDTTSYPRPRFAINSAYPNVQLVWQFRDNSDIGSGTARNKRMIIASNTAGMVYALNKNNGKKKWEFKTGGKIFSTPAVSGANVVVASTDNNIYCLETTSGKQLWKHETLKPIVASPVIHDKTIFVGSSDGRFRAINLQNGTLKWDFDSVKNFVVTRPLVYGDKIIFGSWGTELYCLDVNTGRLIWKWNNGSANRMLSPAACYPVATKNKVFIVAPDRYMSALDAETGHLLWRKQDPANRVRESMGLSLDSGLVYAKTMDGFVIGVSTTAQDMEITWKSDTQLGYELAPTAIVEHETVVFIPSDKGVVTAVNRADGAILWKHKISNSLVTSILPLSKNEVVVSTMDGKISLLRFRG